MSYYNTPYYKTLSLELTDCNICKKRHGKYYLCECDKKILEKNHKYNYQIKNHKRQLRCNKSYSNSKGVYCLNGYADDSSFSVRNYFDIIESKKEKNKKIYNKVVEELKTLMEGPFDPTSECGWQFCEDPCSICEQNGYSFAYWYFLNFFDN